VAARDPDYDPVDDFIATGSVVCDDCGSRVRTRTLESLPPHNCTERARERRAATLLAIANDQGEETHHG
jgi:hypothetical protein